ncbi:hypothetical protein BH10PSE17_BH10PSE17_25080 [soil metagenome]
MGNDDNKIREVDGKFAVGNPGRPKGLTLVEQVRKILNPERDAIVAKLISNVKSEDGVTSNGALKLAMSYLAPPSKGQGEFIDLPGLAEAKTIADKATVVIDAIAAGAISVESGAAVMRMLEILKDSVAYTELRAKVDKLLGISNAKIIDEELL